MECLTPSSFLLYIPPPPPPLAAIHSLPPTLATEGKQKGGRGALQSLAIHRHHQWQPSEDAGREFTKATQVGKEKGGTPRSIKSNIDQSRHHKMLQERFTVLGESPSSPSSSGPFPVLLLICISSSRCLLAFAPLKRQRRRRSSQFLFQWERGEGKEEALFLLPKKKLLLSFIPVFPSTLQRESLHWLFRYRTVHAEGFFFAPFSVRFFAT